MYLKRENKFLHDNHLVIREMPNVVASLIFPPWDSLLNQTITVVFRGVVEEEKKKKKIVLVYEDYQKINFINDTQCMYLS